MNPQQLQRANQITAELDRLNRNKNALSLTSTAVKRDMYFRIEGKQETGSEYYNGHLFYDADVLEVIRILLLNKVETRIAELTEEFNKL